MKAVLLFVVGYKGIDVKARNDDWTSVNLLFGLARRYFRGFCKIFESSNRDNFRILQDNFFLTHTKWQIIVQSSERYDVWGFTELVLLTETFFFIIVYASKRLYVWCYKVPSPRIFTKAPRSSTGTCGRLNVRGFRDSFLPQLT